MLEALQTLSFLGTIKGDSGDFKLANCKLIPMKDAILTLNQ